MTLIIIIGILCGLVYTLISALADKQRERLDKANEEQDFKFLDVAMTMKRADGSFLINRQQRQRLLDAAENLGRSVGEQAVAWGWLDPSETRQIRRRQAELRQEPMDMSKEALIEKTEANVARIGAFHASRELLEKKVALGITAEKYNEEIRRQSNDPNGDDITIVEDPLKMPRP